MSTNEINAPGATSVVATTAATVGKDAPTEQQASQPGPPKRFEKGQTVCNERNEKGKLCNGHLKQVSPIGEDAKQHMRGDDLLYRCQTCGARYVGPPLGHVRDPSKQARYVQSELVAILEAAGGTLPAFKKNDAGAWVPLAEPAPHANTSIPKPPLTAQPAPTSGTDSSPAADAHRPAAEAQAATGQASAAPLSPAAATASPAAGAETVADLAPDASTELTPGAPRDGEAGVSPSN